MTLPGSGNSVDIRGEADFNQERKCHECGHTVQKTIFQCMNCLERYDDETDCCYDKTKEIEICEKCGQEIE